jgi:hypothetical protein
VYSKVDKASRKTIMLAAYALARNLTEVKTILAARAGITCEEKAEEEEEECVVEQPLEALQAVRFPFVSYVVIVIPTHELADSTPRSNACREARVQHTSKNCSSSTIRRSLRWQPVCVMVCHFPNFSSSTCARDQRMSKWKFSL